MAALITQRHYRCDNCGREALTPTDDWWQLAPIRSPRLPDYPTGRPEPDRHFCSDRCLANWSRRRAGGKVNKP